HKLNELLRPLALHDKFAAFVEDDVDLIFLSGEPRIGNLAGFEAMLVEIPLQALGLWRIQLAGVRSQRFHCRRIVGGCSRQRNGSWRGGVKLPAKETAAQLFLVRKNRCVPSRGSIRYGLVVS